VSGKDDRWCILRCSNVKTLELAASLTEAGFEAWSPVETVQPPAKGGGKPERVLEALMPSYVFARASHIIELAELVRSPSLQFRVWDPESRRMVTRGHPTFRFMRKLDGEIATTPDRTLNALRLVERKRKPRGKVKPVAIGATVRLDEGGFAGLTGTVESIEGKFALVAFPGLPMAVKIAMWMLQEQEEQRCAA
jgi:transcription antitermination factor NusG